MFARWRTLRAARLHEIPDLTSIMPLFSLDRNSSKTRASRPLREARPQVKRRGCRRSTTTPTWPPAVTLARGTGAIAIKIYADLSAVLVKKIVEEAHRQGLQAWSHGMVFPATPQEVIDAGPDTVSHVGYLAYEAVEARPSRYEEREKFPIDPGPFGGRQQRDHEPPFRPNARQTHHPRRSLIMSFTPSNGCERETRRTPRLRPTALRIWPRF